MREKYQDTDEGGYPSVEDFDERGQIEWREPLTVAPGPVVAAAHPGSGNSDHTAKYDEGQGEHNGGPGRTPEDGLRWLASHLYGVSSVCIDDNANVGPVIGLQRTSGGMPHVKRAAGRFVASLTLKVQTRI